MEKLWKLTVFLFIVQGEVIGKYIDTDAVLTDGQSNYQFFSVGYTTSLRFKLQAPNDASIILSRDDSEKSIVYRLSLSGSPTFKTRLFKQSVSSVAETHTPGLITEREFREFVLTWNGEKLAFYKGDDPIPVLKYVGESHDTVYYFGVRTEKGAKGEWQFNNVVITPNSRAYKFFPVTSSAVFFKVRAPHDVHIALTHNDYLTDEHYEIFIGANNNDNTEIRRNGQLMQTKISGQSPRLSANEHRGFAIMWKDKQILVKSFGFKQAVYWTSDTQLIQISYIGIRSTKGSVASWTFDDDSDQLKCHSLDLDAKGQSYLTDTYTLDYHPDKSDPEVKYNNIHMGNLNDAMMTYAKPFNKGLGKLIGVRGCHAIEDINCSPISARIRNFRWKENPSFVDEIRGERALERYPNEDSVQHYRIFSFDVTGDNVYYWRLTRALHMYPMYSIEIGVPPKFEALVNIKKKLLLNFGYSVNEKAVNNYGIMMKISIPVNKQVTASAEILHWEKRYDWFADVLISGEVIYEFEKQTIMEDVRCINISDFRTFREGLRYQLAGSFIAHYGKERWVNITMEDFTHH